MYRYTYIYTWGQKVNKHMYHQLEDISVCKGKDVGLLSKDSLKTPTICVYIFSLFFFGMSLELNPVSQVASENSTTEPPTYCNYYFPYRF